MSNHARFHSKRSLEPFRPTSNWWLCSAGSAFFLRRVELEIVDQPVEIAQAQQVGDQAAARVRHQADMRAGRQRLDQFERVVDRALRQRAVLEGIDAAAVAAVERRPHVAVVVAKLAEAAEGAGAGAVHEDEHRLRLPGRGVDRRFLVEAGIERLQLAGAFPAIQSGLLFEAVFDRPHQGLGAGPADTEQGRVGGAEAGCLQRVLDDVVG